PVSNRNSNSSADSWHRHGRCHRLKRQSIQYGHHLSRLRLPVIRWRRGVAIEPVFSFAPNALFIMATILVTWELGLAMGHVGVVRPLIENLIRQGHRVIAALKDVSQAPNLSKNSAVQCLQAPVRLNTVRA